MIGPQRPGSPRAGTRAYDPYTLIWPSTTLRGRRSPQVRAAGRRMQPLGTAIEGAGHAGRATGERFIMASAWRCNGGIRYRLTAPSDTPVRYHRSGVGLQPAARGDGCTGGVPQPLPNTMEAQASFTAQVLKFGLLGTTQTTPRLARANFQTAHTFAGEGTDNLPLWVFVRSDVLDSPGRPAVDPACRTVVMNSDASGQPNSSIGYDYFDLKEMMLDCLDGFGAPGQGDKIFDGKETRYSTSVFSHRRASPGSRRSTRRPSPASTRRRCTSIRSCPSSSTSSISRANPWEAQIRSAGRYIRLK